MGITENIFQRNRILYREEEAIKLQSVWSSAITKKLPGRESEREGGSEVEWEACGLTH